MSFLGPLLIGVGIASLALLPPLIWILRKLPPFARGQSIWRTTLDQAYPPFLAYAVWSIFFGLIILRGLPPGATDIRFDWEKSWPVVEQAEWIYISVYFIPFLVPFMARRPRDISAFVANLLVLLSISLVLFLVLPWISPPRPFEPTTAIGRLLAWETSRPDFAAASFPSFHVFWAFLCAQAIATRGIAWGIGAWIWAIAVACACVLTGAHGIADVAVSAVIFPLVTLRFSPVRAWIQAGAVRLPPIFRTTNASTAPITRPPIP